MSDKAACATLLIIMAIIPVIALMPAIHIVAGVAFLGSAAVIRRVAS